MQVQNYKDKQLLEVIKEWNDLERAKLFLDIPAICQQLTNMFYEQADDCDESLLSLRNSLWEMYEATQTPYLEANPSADWDEEIDECERWINDFYVEKGL